MLAGSSSWWSGRTSLTWFRFPNIQHWSQDLILFSRRRSTTTTPFRSTDTPCVHGTQAGGAGRDGKENEEDGDVTLDDSTLLWKEDSTWIMMMMILLVVSKVSSSRFPSGIFSGFESSNEQFFFSPFEKKGKRGEESRNSQRATLTQPADSTWIHTGVFCCRGSSSSEPLSLISTLEHNHSDTSTGRGRSGYGARAAGRYEKMRVRDQGRWRRGLWSSSSSWRTSGERWKNKYYW